MQNSVYLEADGCLALPATFSSAVFTHVIILMHTERKSLFDLILC